MLAHLMGQLDSMMINIEFKHGLKILILVLFILFLFLILKKIVNKNIRIVTKVKINLKMTNFHAKILLL